MIGDQTDLALNMVVEESRLKTFKNWPFDDNDLCSAQKMAEAGFYFIGNVTDPDSAACFLCKKQLNGWEKEDDPWAEHKSHAPYCMFAQLGKVEKDLSLSEFLSVYHQYLLNNLTELDKDSMEKFEKNVKFVKNLITKKKIAN